MAGELFGCASASQNAGVITASTALVAASDETVDGSCDVARDREAIRGMAGVFDVSFSFEETEALADDYEVHEPYRTSAKEVVVVLEDSERMLSLQHVLVFPGEQDDATGTPLTQKHWRQDWVFEDRELLEFRGHRLWAQRELSADQARCTWSQAVYEVDDGPRYESFGRWEHAEDASVWTSASTWRPLPRREYTKRNDYDVLVGVNKHIVKRDGWVHEQDNVKVVTGRDPEPERELAREHGENRYVRTNDADAAQAVATYLEATDEYWSVVRDAWSQALRVSDQGARARHGRRKAAVRVAVSVGGRAGERSECGCRSKRARRARLRAEQRQQALALRMHAATRMRPGSNLRRGTLVNREAHITSALACDTARAT